jgi:hypothetical protein
MTWTKRNWRPLTLIVVAFLVGLTIARAQTSVPWQATVTGLHSVCTVSPITTPASSTYCFASDGLWVSVNGGAFTQIGAAVVTGVTSFNGRTGAVVSATGDYSFSQISGIATASQVPTPPVTSVNGKTGTVVLSATTAIQ